MTLRNRDGDINGFMIIHKTNETFDVLVKPSWPAAKLTICKVRGRSIIPFAIIRASLRGNNNRLKMKIFKEHLETSIPRKTMVWPVPMNELPACHLQRSINSNVNF